ncbi:tRNA (5-methylaminomethyl-2-thiouridine)(34)-methyltransferase MnmD [Geofilum sp. OHC36d9]|uniref:tRNA (5-methylaminomethyl-2-thiouridine)(34)-methyltransferase MnmD n=1 Tax=Geofilum sp. OHC36d9 TaxID=3458413 RepID=UPI004034C9C6
MSEEDFPKIELMVSEDGSTTLYRPDLDEHYHSVHGAVQESLHVFINAGLKQINKSKFNLLEVGFGTGLNAYLTLASMNGNSECHYHSLEKYPLPKEYGKAINYPEVYPFQGAREFFDRMHQCAWESEQLIQSGFFLRKIETDFNRFQFDASYDLIYFDAFGPDKQAEMWTPDLFVKLSEATNPGGILTTYSAKGTVRRALAAAGYVVDRLPGPPGKREMIRAIKPV